MKKLFALLVLVIFLAGCTGQDVQPTLDYLLRFHMEFDPVVIRVEEVVTGTESPTIEASKTPTLTIMPTKTATITPTPTKTKVVTNTYTPSPTVAVVTPPANARNIYVDIASGSDSNSGLSLSLAYKTIQKAINNALPGDAIYIRAGVYAENLVINRSGTSALPISLAAYNGELVTISGGTNIAIRAASGLSYWTIDGLTVKSTNRYTLRFGWWGENPVTGIVVKNCKLYGANAINGTYSLFENNDVSGVGYAVGSGDAGLMEISSSNHNIFRDNNVHDFTAYNARGIWSQGLTHDTLIENNTVSNIWSSSGGLGQCINLDGAGNVEWRHIVRNNTVSQCSYVGIQLENNFETLVQGNQIDSEGSAGMIIISYDSKVGCKVGGENGQYGNAVSCKGLITNNQIISNLIQTDNYWAWGYAGLKDWDTAGMLIKSNTFIAGSYNADYPAISIDGTPDMVKDVVLEDNIIKTR